MKILLTRPHHSFITTPSRLESLGHDVFWHPLLEIIPTHDSFPTDDYCGFLISSLHSLDFLLQARLPSSSFGLPMITTGTTTASAARELGFTNVQSADGDSLAMASKACEVFNSGDRVLYPCAVSPARDISVILSASGIECTLWRVYSTRETSAFSPAMESLFLSGDLDAVLLYSSSSARCFARLFNDLRIRGNVNFPLIFVLSSFIASQLPSDWRVHCRIATSPNEDSLISLL